MPEVETEISPEVGQDLFSLCGDRTLSKFRRIIPYRGSLKIEVDQFHFIRNRATDLMIAEVELPAVGHPFKPPDWFGEEITGVEEFSNFSLATNGLPA